MDQTKWWGSSAWYRMGLGLLGCCHIHMAGSRRCSDHAELRLPIK
jgi:hypothetical protein